MSWMRLERRGGHNMRAVVQRVLEASVKVDGELISEISKGFLVLLGVETGDDISAANYMASRLSKLRVFEDEFGKMNLDIRAINGQILLISQFTLLGDARGQNRPSFLNAERPEIAEQLYLQTAKDLNELGINTKTGVFGADMKVSLINDGPVTILLDSRKRF